VPCTEGAQAPGSQGCRRHPEQPLKEQPCCPSSTPPHSTLHTPHPTLHTPHSEAGPSARCADVPGPACLPPHAALVEGAPRSKGGATPMPRMEMRATMSSPTAKAYARKLPGCARGPAWGCGACRATFDDLGESTMAQGEGGAGPTLRHTCGGIPRGEPAARAAQCWSVPGGGPGQRKGRGLALAGSGSPGAGDQGVKLGRPLLTPLTPTPAPLPALTPATAPASAWPQGPRGPVQASTAPRWPGTAPPPTHPPGPHLQHQGPTSQHPEPTSSTSSVPSSAPSSEPSLLWKTGEARAGGEASSPLCSCGTPKVVQQTDCVHSLPVGSRARPAYGSSPGPSQHSPGSPPRAAALRCS